MKERKREKRQPNRFGTVDPFADMDAVEEAFDGPFDDDDDEPATPTKPQSKPTKSESERKEKANLGLHPEGQKEERKRGKQQPDRYERRQEMQDGQKTAWPGQAAAEWCWQPGKFSDNRYDRMYHNLNHIMDSDEVVLLTLLIGLRETVDKPDKLHQRFRVTGWFWCSTELLWQELGWDDAKQGRVFRKLEKKGFVERDRHRKRDAKGRQVGPDAVRWCRINHGRVNEAVAEHRRNFNYHRYG